MSTSPLDINVHVDSSFAERAFDLLGAAAPIAVAAELKLLATEVKIDAERDAPGTLAEGWEVVDIHDSLAASPVIGYVVATPDKERHGDKPVARWVNYGTGAKADKRVIRDGNAEYHGQRAQRFLRKKPRKLQAERIHKALVREARRAGFVVTETA